MRKKLKKSFIPLMIFLVLIVSIGAISAADAQNVDETASADDEIALEATDVALESSSDENILSAEGDGTFTDLSNNLTGKSEVTLESDYTYSADTDSAYANGITVDRELTINGNGKTLNPNGNLLFKIGTGGTLTLNDMTIVNSYTKTDAMIQNSGNLILNNVTFTVERFIPATAGTYKTIENSGEMTVTNSIFKDSYIHMASNPNSRAMSIYGIIYNTQKITIENTIFDNNKMFNPANEPFGRTMDICALLHNTNEMLLNNVVIQNTNVSYVPYSNNHFEGIIFNEKGNLQINSSIIKDNTIYFPENENSNLMGVIYNEATNANLIISNSIIAGNSHMQKTVQKEIIRNKGVATLNENYWGSNNPNFSKLINGGTAPTNFVVLGFEPETVTAGEAKTFEITLNKVNSSGAISNLETGTLPNYNITVSSKKLGDTIVEIKNGAGQYTYLPVTAGEDIITINSEEYTITVNAAPAGTFTDLNNTIAANDEVNLYSNYTYDSSSDSALQTGIPINKEVTINGNGYTINSTNLARLFNVGSEGKLILNNVVLITDLVVAQTAASNGNILNKGEITFDRVIFTSNRIWQSGTIFAPAISNDGTLNIKNTEFIDSIAKYTGTTAVPYGLIHNKGILNIEDSLFKNNGIYSSGTSMSGQTGLIYNAKILNMENTVFENNYITHDREGNAMSTINGIIYGGNSASEIYINNCTFKENSLTTKSTNANANTYGALCIRYGKITVSNSNFIKNTAITGAAIELYMASNVNLISENNTFDSNIAEKNGGAIYVYSAAILTSTNDKFINNAAGNGGAIYGQTSTTNNANISIENSIFEGNTATIGTAIYNSAKTTANNNYWGTNTPSFDTLITNGTTSLTPENYIIMTIEGETSLIPESVATYTVNFKTNDTNEVKELPDYKVDLTATNSLSDYSVVISEGSASFTYTSSLEEITDTIKASVDSVEKAALTVTVQEDPTAKGTYKELDRLIRKTEGELVLTKDYTFDSTIDTGFENGIVIDKTLTINGHGFTINSTDLARLFRIDSTGNLTLKDINIVSDYTATATSYSNARSLAGFINNGILAFDNVTFTINQNTTAGVSALAAGIYNTKTFTITDSKFVNSNIATNTQYCFGLIDNTGTLTVSNTLFDNNIMIESSAMATVYADGLIYNMGTLIFDNVNVTNNYMKTQSTARGLIRGYTHSKITITDSIFENNTIESVGNNAQGTTIYAESESMSISNSKFVKNTGALSGGAIYSTITGAIYDNNTFERNTANGYGGAIYSSGSQAIYTNNTFKENEAQEGGALYTTVTLQSQKSYYFTGNVFIENKATKNGGAISTTASIGSSSYPIKNNIFINNQATGEEGTTTGKGGAIYSTATLRIIKSIFQGNVAKEGAAAYTTGSSASLIEQSIFDDNVITSPTGTLIYYRGGSTANNNYWGTNEPDFSKIIAVSGGTLTYPSNFVLLAIEGNEVISSSDMYSITFKNNVTGDTVELPDYTVNLTSNINTLNPESVMITDGEAVFEYDVASYGSDTIKAISNNQEKAKFDITVTESQKTPVFNITANDVTYGEELDLTFSLTEGPEGYDIYIWTIYDEENNPIESDYLDTTSGKIVYAKEYAAGKYTIKVALKDVEGWEDFEVNDTFEVKQAETELTPVITVNDDNSVDIQVTVTSGGKTTNAAGKINTTIDIAYEKNVENGMATIITNVLSNGTYNAVIAYSGDKNYTGSSAPITITIKNIVPEDALNLTGSNNTNTPTFSIKLPENATGNLTVTIGDETITQKLENGSATVTFEDLKPGNHTATVTYTGDENYNSITKETTVSIPKKEIPGGESALNPTTPEGSDSPSYTINLPPDATGNLTVTVDGKDTYTQELVNGSATVTVPKLSAGAHTITVSYSGDKNYTGISKTSNINVAQKTTPDTGKKTKKVASKIIAKKKTFKAKKKVKKYTITLKAGKKPIKKVQITLKIKGKTYKAKTNAKGKATFKIKKLTKKGKYTAVIKFKGNKLYKAATKKVKITVKK